MAAQVLDAVKGKEAGGAKEEPASSSLEPIRLEMIVAVLAGLATAWVGAGSVGLLAHSLRHALEWVLLGIVLCAAWPKRWSPRAAIIVITGVIIAVAVTSSWLPANNVLAPAALLAAVALVHGPRERSALTVACAAVVTLAIWRLALTSIPTLWLMADNVGYIIGRIGGALSGQPLWVGATFAGLDFLVLMLAFTLGYLAITGAPRRRRLLFALLAIAAAQLIYLMALALAPKLLAILPPPQPPNPAIPFQQDTKTWADMVRDFVPWDTPILCAVLQLIVAGFILRWATIRVPPPTRQSSNANGFSGATLLVTASCIVLATLLPAILVIGSTPSTQLKGKKIVFYERGFLNWLRPEHGQYGRLSQGMYGMLPAFVQSLGGRAMISPDLRDEDLKDADVVVLLYPNHPWSDWREPHGEIQRVWDFVKRGGSLLMFSDHTIREADGRNRANDMLAPRQFARSRRAELRAFLETCKQHRADIDGAMPVGGDVPVAPEDYADDPPKEYSVDAKPARLAYDLAHEQQAKLEYDRLGALESLPDSDMRVRFDAAEFVVGGWLQSYEALSHPTNTGMHDDRNQFGVVIGASMQAPFPARPLLVGRWGWLDEGDAGSAAAMLGNHKIDPGEKIGDMVLAAEERIGNGRIVAFADTSSVTNGINIGAHEYTARLLTYLANDGANPQQPARQFLGAIVAIALIVLIGLHPSPSTAGLTAVAMALSLAICTGWTYGATSPIPDGRQITLDRPKVVIDQVSGRAQTPRQEFVAAAPTGQGFLVYVDSSHLPESSEEGWRPDGTAGLSLAFMRDGYLSLQLFDLSEERLSKAAFYVLIAPSRHFTSDERDMLKRYVEKGGVLIVTAGWDKPAAAQEVLSEFGLYIGVAPPAPGKPTPAPEPLGFFKSPYYDGAGYQCFVRFHAAWPVGPDPAQTPDESLHVVATGRLNNRDVPVILRKTVGKGMVVLVGDTCFAMNKNLETENGDLFDGMHENADFWRWFIPQLSGGTPWLPPKQVPLDPATGQPIAAATQPDTQPAAAPVTQPAGPPAPPPTTQPATGPATQAAAERFNPLATSQFLSMSKSPSTPGQSAATEAGFPNTAPRRAAPDLARACGRDIFFNPAPAPPREIKGTHPFLKGCVPFISPGSDTEQTMLVAVAFSAPAWMEEWTREDVERVNGGGAA